MDRPNLARKEFWKVWKEMMLNVCNGLNGFVGIFNRFMYRYSFLNTFFAYLYGVCV